MAERKGINKNVVLTGLIIGMFFSALEQTIVGTAMPTILGELQGFAIMAWVTTAYLITSTVIVPIVGKLSDLYGRRYLYLIGTIIFTIGSALCATATTMEQLIMYRALQGLGGGMVMPLSQTIIGDIFTAEQRAKWQGVFGGIFGLSSVIGPFIGGFLVDTISWHWIFLINVPFGLLSAILIFTGMRRELVARLDKVYIDYAGIAALVPFLVLLLLGLSLGGNKFAWNSATSYWLFGGSAVLLVVFLLLESRAKEPILDLSLFRNRVFSVTNGLGFLLGFAMFGAIIFVPLFMQGILGVSPTKAGSTMTPMMIALIAASVIGGRLLLKVRYRAVLTAGMVIAAIGFYLISRMNVDTTQFIAYFNMVILGLGMGLVMPTLMIAVQNEFSKSQLGTVTSAATFFRSIGGTIGVTVFTAIMNNKLQNNVVNATAKAQDDPGLFAAITALENNPDVDLFSILIRPELLEKVGIPGELQTKIVSLVQVAWTSAFSVVFLSGLAFVAFGVLVALLVGKGRIKSDKERQQAVQANAVRE
ncbi:MDR family MFS transporter [Paenibacillus sp. GCM10012307]|uniref:MFS transporter n=1 Tax=Paenibacillus roseus TaxID=2798579 RepID=A0A934JA06_9BACL|nr:MDR family MFS transporter [Paenibacillus roseus]MBJ6363013.1 MFS transporter [Paenibacillus roseus]